MTDIAQGPPGDLTLRRLGAVPGRLLAALPSGLPLEDAAWARRHKAILALAWAHVGGVVAFAAYRGFPLDHGLLEGGLVAVGAAAASLPLSRTVRACAASLALLAASAVLVHLSGGYIEMHFHFFVMLAVISLYQSWTPFLVAIGFVVVEHGALGVLDPASVYNHPDAVAHPWTWAAIHGVFVLGASVASLVVWRLNEDAHGETARTLSLLSATLESTADGILVVDNESRILRFNQQFVSMWRIPPEIIASRDDQRALAYVTSQLTHPAAFLAKVRELYAQPDAESFDVLEFKDGRVFERYSKPQRVDGRSVGRVWSFRDVTERRRSEEHAREVERLTALDQFKTQFINMAAHELGTPLTPIKVQVHMLKRTASQGADAKITRELDVLERNVNRLVKLVRDVLDGARAQASQLKLQRSMVDLNQAVWEAVESFTDAAVESGITLEVSDDLDGAVDADPIRISQVLYNLLSNAIKWTPRGGVVRVVTEQRGSEAVVRVSDSGVGMNEAQVAKLFLPFSQVHDRMQHTQPGTGLGLYIARSIVEQHGGRVWAESDGPGKGSTFGFALPLPAIDVRVVRGDLRH